MTTAPTVSEDCQSIITVLHKNIETWKGNPDYLRKIKIQLRAMEMFTAHAEAGGDGSVPNQLSILADQITECPDVDYCKRLMWSNRVRILRAMRRADSPPPAPAAMQSVNGDVREALRPLAELGGLMDGHAAAFYDLPADTVVFENSGQCITAGDIRNARMVYRALSQSPATSGSERDSIQKAVIDTEQSGHGLSEVSE